VSGPLHAPAALQPRPIGLESMWAPDRSGRCGKEKACTFGNRTRSPSLYRLSYPEVALNIVTRLRRRLLKNRVIFQTSFRWEQLVKRPGRDVRRSPPLSAEARGGWAVYRQKEAKAHSGRFASPVLFLAVDLFPQCFVPQELSLRREGGGG
jgi:hypothetical protein